MERERGKQTLPGLFSATGAGDAWPPPPSPPAPEATAESVPQRHVLPKNLRKAVKHLSDEELDLLHAAILEEMKMARQTPAECWGGFAAVSSFLALADETVAFNW